MRNYLPRQYKENSKLKINHNYLSEQFADYEVILEKIKNTVIKGDFTLGEEVDLLENEFSKIHNVKESIAVGSGTDAIMLSLKAIGVTEGDEVITSPFTFFATIGAIVTAGAKPVFVDVSDDMNIDCTKIESVITHKSRAIVPVHWTGKMCNMNFLDEIANVHKLSIVSDACHAILATYKDKTSAEYGDLACYSFHPLKNLNIWGDGGIIATNRKDLAKRLRLIRNHGLKNRDECLEFSYNSRLDTIQAVVARHMLQKIQYITKKRIENALYLDKCLSEVDQIKIPGRQEFNREVFHLYMISCQRRDDLKQFLIENGVDAKVHYPIPMHMQPAAKYLGYAEGDFPIAEQFSKNALSLPVHEFISKKQLDFVVEIIKNFYIN